MQVGLVTVGFFCMLKYGIYSHDTAARIMVISGLILIQAGMSGITLMRNKEPELRFACGTLAVQLLIVAACMGLRGILTWHFGADFNYLAKRSWFQVGGMLVFLVSAAIIPLGFFWMTTAREQVRLERTARTDSLTGLLNRRALEMEVAREVSRHCRLREPFSALMLDIDHFKKLNDSLGHLAGDGALQSIARILTLRARQIDVVARLGGEEFVVILPGSSLSGALRLAEHLRCEIAETQMEFRGAQFRLTVSIGVACFRPAEDSWEELLRRSDGALYMAKARGRNTVVSDDECREENSLSQ